VFYDPADIAETHARRAAKLYTVKLAGRGETPYLPL